MTREEATIEKINLESALRITNDWLSKVQYDAPYFGSGDMEAIKKALEKQIPKKPKMEEDDFDYGDAYVCQVCGTFIAYEIDRISGYCELNYCNNCGQALDWTEEGE